MSAKPLRPSAIPTPRRVNHLTRRPHRPHTAVSSAEIDSLADSVANTSFISAPPTRSLLAAPRTPQRTPQRATQRSQHSPAPVTRTPRRNPNSAATPSRLTSTPLRAMTTPRRVAPSRSVPRAADSTAVAPTQTASVGVAVTATGTAIMHRTPSRGTVVAANSSSTRNAASGSLVAADGSAKESAGIAPSARSLSQRSGTPTRLPARSPIRHGPQPASYTVPSTTHSPLRVPVSNSGGASPGLISPPPVSASARPYHSTANQPDGTATKKSPSPPFTPWNVDAIAQTPNKRDNDRWLKNFGIDLTNLRAAGLLPPAPTYSDDSDSEDTDAEDYEHGRDARNAVDSDEEGDELFEHDVIDRMSMPTSFAQVLGSDHPSEQALQQPEEGRDAPVTIEAPFAQTPDARVQTKHTTPCSVKQRQAYALLSSVPSPHVQKSLQPEMDEEVKHGAPEDQNDTKPSTFVLEPLKLDSLELSHYGDDNEAQTSSLAGSMPIKSEEKLNLAATTTPSGRNRPRASMKLVTPSRPPRRSLAGNELRRAQQSARSRRVSTRELRAIVLDQDEEDDMKSQDVGGDDEVTEVGGGKPVTGVKVEHGLARNNIVQGSIGNVSSKSPHPTSFTAGSDVVLTPVRTGARLRAQLGGAEMVITPVRRSVRLSRREGSSAGAVARMEDDAERKRLLESVGYAYAPNHNL